MKSVKGISAHVALCAAITLAAVFSGCAKHESTASAVAAQPESTFFPIAIGNQTANLQVAVTPQEMELGLMNRRDLREDDGMVFVFDRPQQMRFWMRNTPTPLDVGYFTPDGVLREVYQMYPYDETTVSSHGLHLQFAVEMRQGWFAQHNLHAGAALDLKALIAAIRARGADPQKLGL